MHDVEQQQQQIDYRISENNEELKKHIKGRTNSIDQRRRRRRQKEDGTITTASLIKTTAEKRVERSIVGVESIQQQQNNKVRPMAVFPNLLQNMGQTVAMTMFNGMSIGFDSCWNIGMILQGLKKFPGYSNKIQVQTHCHLFMMKGDEETMP